jgi:hypothetical protein
MLIFSLTASKDRLSSLVSLFCDLLMSYFIKTLISLRLSFSLVWAAKEFEFSWDLNMIVRSIFSHSSTIIYSNVFKVWFSFTFKSYRCNCSYLSSSYSKFIFSCSMKTVWWWSSTFNTDVLHSHSVCWLCCMEIFLDYFVDWGLSFLLLPPELYAGDTWVIVEVSWRGWFIICYSFNFYCHTLCCLFSSSLCSSYVYLSLVSISRILLSKYC